MSQPTPTDHGKWGIMGGAFDPIHFAHLILAEQARISFKLNGVLFVPSHNPPHRENSPKASFDHRLKMVRLAIAGNDYFSAGGMERNIKGPSYTYTLVKNLREEYPRIDWYLILGTDNIAIFDKWYKPHEIVEMVRVVVGRRPGSESELDNSPWMKNIERFEMPLLDESSTYIRRAIKNGRSIRYMLPESVRKYIISEGLYL